MSTGLVVRRLRFDWLQRNGRRIAAIVTLAAGLFLVGYGLLQL